MKRAWASGLLIVGACGNGSAPPPVVPRTPGPPPPAQVATPAAPSEPVFDTAAPPALRLPTNFAPEGYTARLAIDPAQPAFTGSMQITGDLAQPSAVIWLHGKQLTVRRATATHDTQTSELTVTPRGEDLLELRPRAPLPAGHYELALDYDGKLAPPGASEGAFIAPFGDDGYLTTQFEATSARLVFPCVDEPGSKVPWQLTLDVPKGLVAVSNTPALREVPLDAAHVRVAFAKTRPLPTYLIAFGVGPFDIVDAGHSASGTPLRLLVPRGQAKRAAYAAAELPKIVDALAAWTAIPFPYPKLDVVARNAGGAMENAGVIMTEASEVLMDGTPPSATARHEMISTIGHETAHQWFGDLVTAAWWDDIWLNEAFATFMEDKIEVALEPAWHDADYMLSRRIFSSQTDALASARQIRQPITNEGDIHNSFDGATYYKGATVLAMFEAHVGEDVFQRGIRAYLAAHADHNATVTDVVAAVDAASGKHLARAFASFLDQPGIPELEVAVACTAGKPARATIRQHRAVAVNIAAPAKESTWILPLCVAYDTSSHARGEACGWIDQPTLELELPDSTCPTWVLPDAGAHAYARAALTEAQVIALRDHAWDQLSAPERRAVLESARARALDGKLPIAVMMSLASKLMTGGRYEVGDALTAGVGFGLRDLVPPDQLERARARVRSTIAPLVKRLGLLPKPGDTLDDERDRLYVAYVGAWADDPTLAREAVALAAHYRDVPSSIRAMVLRTAANASPAIAAKLRADAFGELDPERRGELFGALGAIRDPARLRASLDLALDPHARASDVLALLSSWSDEPARAVVETWLRLHWSDVQRAVPTLGSEDFPPLLRLRSVFTPCDASRRDELAAYLTATFGVLPSGARPTQNAIDGMDQCIARRKLVEPSLRAWLAARVP